MMHPELSRVEIQGMTRGAFILRGALATGAVYGVGAVAPFVSRAFGAVPQGDVQILEFALSLEQLESAFYKAALANAGLTGDAQKIATAFGAHEDEHVKALEQLLTQLGSKPAEAPKTKFGLTDEASFFDLAVTLEDTGIGAYNGAGPQLESVDIISALGTIVQIEGRHSGALRMMTGQDPAPEAFDKPLPPAEVSSRVQPFLQT
jgi:ferritin-like protein